jgi:NAD+ synthase
VDLSPIADLMKTEGYETGKFLGITEEIVNAKPTDGLYGDSRTDEDQIGASYPELEWAMEEAETGKTTEDFEGRKKEVFKIYKNRHSLNLHKMNSIPVCDIPVNLKK